MLWLWNHPRPLTGHPARKENKWIVLVSPSGASTSTNKSWSAWYRTTPLNHFRLASRHTKFGSEAVPNFWNGEHSTLADPARTVQARNIKVTSKILTPKEQMCQTVKANKDSAYKLDLTPQSHNRLETPSKAETGSWRQSMTFSPERMSIPNVYQPKRSKTDPSPLLFKPHFPDTLQSFISSCWFGSICV